MLINVSHNFVKGIDKFEVRFVKFFILQVRNCKDIYAFQTETGKLAERISISSRL